MAKKSNIKFRNSLGGRVLAGAMSMAQLIALAGCPTDTPEPTPVQKPDPDPDPIPDPQPDPKPWETITVSEDLGAKWKEDLEATWAEWLEYPEFEDLVKPYNTIEFKKADSLSFSADKTNKTLVISFNPIDYAAAMSVMIKLETYLTNLAAVRTKINAAYLASARENAAFTKKHVRTLFTGRSYGA